MNNKESLEVTAIIFEALPKLMSLAQDLSPIWHSAADAYKDVHHMAPFSRHPLLAKNQHHKSSFIGRSILAAALLGASYAQAQDVANHALTIPAHPQKSMVTEGVNVSLKGFLDAYMGTDLERQRLAEAFLIGILDTTEAKTWCSYSTTRTITITEHLIPALGKLPVDQWNDRAAPVIEANLKRLFPCKDAK